MTFLQFTYWVIAFYGLYYLFMILSDLHKQKNNSADSEVKEITFENQEVPKLIPFEVIKQKAPSIPDPPTKALGGVTLKGLFELAKAEAIVITNPVSF